MLLFDKFAFSFSVCVSIPLCVCVWLWTMCPMPCNTKLPFTRTTRRIIASSNEKKRSEKLKYSYFQKICHQPKTRCRGERDEESNIHVAIRANELSNEIDRTRNRMFGKYKLQVARPHHLGYWTMAFASYLISFYRVDLKMSDRHSNDVMLHR